MPAARKLYPAIVVGGMAISPAFGQEQIETVVVTANAPLPGSNIDADKIAGEVETLSMGSLARDRQQDTLPNAVATQLSSVSINAEQGNQFQPDFLYRGFEASPVSGVAEGIAVYQDGVRLNESFGDNVNWDLIPEFAVETFAVQSNNPVFGLNTLGGAVTLNMKSGLSFSGAEAELSAGSFGNVTGDAEYGTRFGKFAFYAGFGGVTDDGFRYRSPTRLLQGYSDLAYEDGPLTLHVSLSGASNSIAAVGPTPVELLAQDSRMVFTSPQRMQNEMQQTQFRGTWQGNDGLTFSFNSYWRHFHQSLVDGNTTDVDYCENDAAWLCLGGDDRFPNDVLFDKSGNPVQASVLPNGATPGETDFTHTDTNTVGGAAQLSWATSLGGHGNNLVIGASVDHGDTNYSAFGELGTLLDSLKVVGAGVIIDEAQNPNASPPIETPVHLDAQNSYGGIYAMDVFDITPVLSWTLSGRLNTAGLKVTDLRGTALDGEHTFLRFNPGTGIAYKLSPELTTYAGYSESNRAPTAGELSCADPAAPCILDAFLVSDPALKQVTSRTYELGLRGRFTVPALDGQFTWNIGAYRTDADNDIRLLATDINGFGFFANAGTTRHQGVDAHLGYRDARWKLAANYSYLDVTFRDALVLSSNSPAANGDGVIFVRPGDRIPLNPVHRLTFTADYAILPAWSIGVDLRLQGSEYLAGDDSNQERQLPGFATANLRSAYALDARFSVYGEIQNLFDRRYYTYGAFTALDGLPPNFNLTDPRTYSPAPGRLFFAGVRAALD
ncbi:MAG TPA: TonB-dependent receptor [Rhizomicrobium sp.]|jgi:iron complex outermembrane receptor protein|nr:TonB-dependent receptor [Rhizomicrobium sp.]